MKIDEEIKTDHIEVKKTARVSTYGKLSDKTKYCWLVLHGSNMLCEQMLYKFAGFDPEEHFVIAPEAILRAYVKQFGGDVVASWMTKRDRLHEIDDLAYYLNQVVTKYFPQLPEGCKKIVLGFSQGGTMAYRWLNHSKVDLDLLIGYATWLPEEISLKESKTDLKQLKMVYTVGASDPFINEKRLPQVQEVMTKNGLDIPIEMYDGDHRVKKEQLKFLFEKYVEN